MSIWIKEHKEWIIIMAVTLLLSSVSFGMGYLYAKEGSPAPIIIEKCSKDN